MSSPTRAIMPMERAQELINKIVKMSKADGITVTIDSGYQADVRPGVEAGGGVGARHTVRASGLS